MCLLYGARRVVVLPHELDIYIQNDIRALLSFDGCCELIVDLRETRYMDATAITEIVRARKAGAACGKKMTLLVATSSTIAKIFRLLHLEDELEIVFC